MSIKRKLFGSLQLDNFKQAVAVEGKLNTHEKYGKQLKVSGVEFEDGNIGISIWDAANNTAIKLGTLMTSKIDDSSKTGHQKAAEGVDSSDLPF